MNGGQIARVSSLHSSRGQPRHGLRAKLHPLGSMRSEFKAPFRVPKYPKHNPSMFVGSVGDGTWKNPSSVTTALFLRDLQVPKRRGQEPILSIYSIAVYSEIQSYPSRHMSSLCDFMMLQIIKGKHLASQSTSKQNGMYQGRHLSSVTVPETIITYPS